MLVDIAILGLTSSSVVITAGVAPMSAAVVVAVQSRQDVPSIQSRSLMVTGGDMAAAEEDEGLSGLGYG
jgi:hypothetical protein